MKRYLHAILPACALFTATAAEAQRAVILDDLRVQPITRLLTLSDHELEVEYPSGDIRRLSADQIVALTQTTERTTTPQNDLGWIELVDGQRIVGRAAELASDSEAVGWTHRDFGVLWLPLDRVSSIVPIGLPVDGIDLDASEQLGDSVYLSNGDVLDGYLLHAGNEVEIEHFDGATSTMPIERVSYIQLANDAQTPAGNYVWLADGSIFAVRSIIDVTGERVQVELRTGETAVLRVAQILGVLSSADHLYPLTSLSLQDEKNINGRRWASGATVDPAADSPDAPLLFARDIFFPGPMSLRWELPNKATFFGTTIEMPPEAFPWGDCEVIIKSGESEIFRARLNEESPRHEISIGLSSTDLQIQVLPGEHGPINDLVHMHAPLVYISDD